MSDNTDWTEGVGMENEAEEGVDAYEEGPEGAEEMLYTMEGTRVWWDYRCSPPRPMVYKVDSSRLYLGKNDVMQDQKGSYAWLNGTGKVVVSNGHTKVQLSGDDVVWKVGDAFKVKDLEAKAVTLELKEELDCV